MGTPDGDGDAGGRRLRGVACGLSGLALAGTGGDPNPGGLGLVGGNALRAPVSTVCGDASALPGIGVAGCGAPGGGSVATFASPTPRASAPRAGASGPEPGPGA